MKKIVLTALLALCPVGLAGGLEAPIPPSQAVQRVNTTLDLGDFTAPAQWTYPANSTGKLPAVLLIHGSTPADMDFTVTSPSGQVLSHIFGDIAEGLSQQGVAVLRYNKHYVTAAGQVDYESYYGKADLHTFLQDAETALAAIKANPRIDPNRIFVYGWSEGSGVAAALVRQHPEVAGLILQGPVTLPWADLFDKQLTDVQLPYLKSVVPEGLTPQNFARVMQGQGGMVAKSALMFAVNPEGLAGGRYELNMEAFDQNKNGVIELDEEYLPGARFALNYLIETPGAPLAIYSADRALPVATAQANYLQAPVLILQGMNDANTPAKYLSHLTTALTKEGVPTTVKLYPGLGHSLGQTPSLLQDNFQPIVPQPINDTARWILQQK